ncbi:hypothetical protein, partial [Xanthobacter autotrophicus]|uniref:hypothetical protein n=1 Tax=Xanthobacter autotrophicus TaxID=280 RepID=UPI00372A757E
DGFNWSHRPDRLDWSHRSDGFNWSHRPDRLDWSYRPDGFNWLNRAYLRYRTRRREAADELRGRAFEVLR